MNIKSSEIRKKNTKHIKGRRLFILVLLKNKFLDYKNIMYNIMMFDMELNENRRWYYCQKIGKRRKKINPCEESSPVRTNSYLIKKRGGGGLV